MMEKKYQHMMEQVNMDEGFASGLLERIREGRPKRRPRPLRTALIAACVCLALVGTAVAASDIIQQYFHTQVVDSYDEMIPEQSDGEESAIRFTAPSGGRGPGRRGGAVPIVLGGLDERHTGRPKQRHDRLCDGHGGRCANHVPHLFRWEHHGKISR